MATISSRGIFFPERLPKKDRDEIHRFAADHGIGARYIEGLRTFRKRLFKYAYRKGYRLPVVSWNLPAHLARLAADWVPAADGGWDLIVWDQPNRQKKGRPRRSLRNGMIEDPWRPRIHMIPIEGGRAAAWFAGRLKPDRSDRIPDGKRRPRPKWNYRGRFVDLSGLCYGLAGSEFDGLSAAGAAFGIDAELPVSDGSLRMELDRVWATCRAEKDLYRAALREHDELGLPFHPHRIFSPSSYASASRLDAGYRPLLERMPDFPRDVLSGFMGATFGGENLVGAIAPRDVPVPAVTLDMTGQYAVSHALSGSAELEAAKEIVVVPEDPTELVEFVERVASRVEGWLDGESDACPISPAEFRRLARTLVHVRPEKDVLAHRRRSKLGRSWRMHVAPLTSEDPVPVLLSACLRARLESGRCPTILQGVCLVPKGRIKALRKVTLPDGTVARPGESLPLAWATCRLRLGHGDETAHFESPRVACSHPDLGPVSIGSPTLARHSASNSAGETSPISP